MAEHESTLSGPDLATEGAPRAELADGGMLLGHAGSEAVVLVRRGEEVFALGATCTHYGGPLAEGLFDGALLRCPWHHACFDVRSGQPVRPPALNPIPRFEVPRARRSPVRQRRGGGRGGAGADRGAGGIGGDPGRRRGRGGRRRDRATGRVRRPPSRS